jgi:hypothetical protein
MKGINGCGGAYRRSLAPTSDFGSLNPGFAHRDLDLLNDNLAAPVSLKHD